jgi:hypothetical protein
MRLPSGSIAEAKRILFVFDPRFCYQRIVNPENPKHEDSQLIVLADTTAVYFYCKCGAPISNIPIESVDGQKIGEIARSKCPACGEESGFSLRGDKEGRDTQDKLSELRKLLTEDMRENLMRIEEHLRLVARLTKDRNLKVRFNIKSPE